MVWILKALPIFLLNEGQLRKEAVKIGPALNLPFSPGVRLGNLLFVSGQGPNDKDGKVVPGNTREQTRITLENFKRIVEAAGSTMANVVQTVVYLKDLNDFAAMNEIYSQFFPDPKPARTTVQAGLLFEMRVEIQGTAYIP